MNLRKRLLIYKSQTIQAHD